MEQPTENPDPLFQVVDNVLTQVFGEKTAQVIYRHLESRYALRQSEFSNRIEVFAKGLESILQTHASSIERRILKEFCASYGSMYRLDLADNLKVMDFAAGMRLAMQKT
jgi:hypothetical protein